MFITADNRSIDQADKLRLVIPLDIENNLLNGPFPINSSFSSYPEREGFKLTIATI